MRIEATRGDKALVKKLELKSESEFLTPDDSDGKSPIYEVMFAGPDFESVVGSFIILANGDYSHVLVGDDEFLAITNDDVLCTVKEK